ncbi:MAG: hypothetical protein Q8L14_13035 [Myxococcales bacterium]|nr:hypothetical protein [Myxococcales bacterium]
MAKPKRINLKGRLAARLAAALEAGEASGFTRTYSLKKVLEAVARAKR